jgi:(1->4)-alpha-D-glucan 1-alpha-D-glucosylmutase
MYVQAVTELAVLHRPDLRHELLFLKRLLLSEFGEQDFPDTEFNQTLYGKIVQKFQQLTAPLMAKGFEDTALYVYNRLLSLNEVGADPGRFGCSMDEFHQFMHTRVRRWPHSMNATSTHDSKRGEDVRARLNVLSEIPEKWRSQLNTWHENNRTLKKTVQGRTAPDKNEEYFVYQTLLGVWPTDGPADEDLTSRIQDYMLKALREAKVHSSWIEPDPHYEASMAAFIENLLDPSDSRQFISDFLPFWRKTSWYGLLNSLSQCLIKITVPGIPDFYQGTEMVELTLVDPDNRRDVDFQFRAQALENIRERMRSDRNGLIDELTAARPLDTRIKLFLTASALDHRRANSELYRDGDYVPLRITGRHRHSAIAFARRMADQWSVTVAPRFISTWVLENQLALGEELWKDTTIVMPQDAPSQWTDVFSENNLDARPGAVLVGQALNRFPVALLICRSLP